MPNVGVRSVVLAIASVVASAFFLSACAESDGESPKTTEVTSVTGSPATTTPEMLIEPPPEKWDDRIGSTIVEGTLLFADSAYVIPAFGPFDFEDMRDFQQRALDVGNAWGVLALDASRAGDTSEEVLELYQGQRTEYFKFARFFGLNAEDEVPGFDTRFADWYELRSRIAETDAILAGFRLND